MINLHELDITCSHEISLYSSTILSVDVINNIPYISFIENEEDYISYDIHIINADEKIYFNEIYTVFLGTIVIENTLYYIFYNKKY